MFIHESGTTGRPTIVFLHGNGASGTMWKAHMVQLTDFHCLAPDFPGFGQSNHQKWVSIQETSKRIIEMINNRAQQGCAHIVGLSLGGSIAMTLLGRMPQVIDHAIVDGAGVLPLPGLPLMKVGVRILQPFLHTDFIIKTIARSMKIHADEYTEFRQGMLAMSPSAFTRSFLEANAMRQPPGLEKITSPVLFVAGENEPKEVKRSHVMLAQSMPNAKSRVAPGMGHGWLAEAPDLHIQMIRSWVNDEPLPQELLAVSHV
ncbi:MAG: alpha/beta hydrolase [Anaerolineae bacterium]|nr:alpha/beta hydrolase [Anaerolineae bacterium]